MALISALTRYEVPPSPMGRYTLNHTMAKNRIRSERKKEKKRFLPKSRKIEKSVFFFLAGRKNGEMEYYGEYLVKYLCVGWLQYVLSANGRLL